MNKCGGCTACCTTFEIIELGKPAFTPCVHLVEGGCGIYDTRPDACRRFVCSWLAGKMGRDSSLRPDNLGLVASGSIDEGIGPTAHIMESRPGAADELLGNRWFCQQTQAAERGLIQPVVLIRKQGTLVYGTPELIETLNRLNLEQEEVDQSMSLEELNSAKNDSSSSTITDIDRLSDNDPRIKANSNSSIKSRQQTSTAAKGSVNG